MRTDETNMIGPPPAAAPTESLAIPPLAIPPSSGGALPGLCITALAALPAGAFLDETALAGALDVNKRTIRRMVGRFELPPGVLFGGRKVWQPGAVLRWFEQRADRAAREAERAAMKFRALA
jgi:hypothetical protein